MFIDRARILVASGDGGNGMSSFRREKYVPRGGPSGGDGGKGGDVILQATSQANTLVDFRYRRVFRADRGEHGKSSNKFGKNAEDLIIEVPCGTVVTTDDGKTLLADLLHDGQRYVAAKGGRGGRGNAKFSTSANRAPTFSENGEPGQEMWLRLELKILADVGLIGYPSVGKSSLIRKVSGAKPEVAAYHFTTLNPVLGVVRLHDAHEFVMADIPGLIEGASQGIGLGHNFLRHIERTKLLVHVVDVAGTEGRNPSEDVDVINTELSLYSEQLTQKKQLIAANKTDMLTDPEQLQRFIDDMNGKGLPVYPISTLTGEGIPVLLEAIWKELETLALQADTEDTVLEPIVYDEVPVPDFTVSRTDDAAFVLHGARIEKLVAMTRFDDEQSLLRFQKIWRHMELDQLLQEHGIKEGDTVRIGGIEFEYKE